MMQGFKVFFFFLLAMVISWAGWIPFAASQAGLIDAKIAAEWVWLAEFGPSLAAIIIVLIYGGRASLKELLRRILIWRVNWKWYLFAVGITPLIALLSLLMGHLFLHENYDLTLLSAWDSNFIARTADFKPSLGLIEFLLSMMERGPLAVGIIFILLAITNGGISEEIGWRGFALEEIQRGKSNILWSSLGVAVLWAFWHTGTFFWQQIMSTPWLDGLRFSLTYLFQYLLLLLPLSVFYTVLYNSCNKSIAMAVLLHAFYNITISIFATALPNFPMLIFLVLLWISALGIVIRHWPKADVKSVGDLSTN